MSLESTEASGLISISSTTSATAYIDPPNKSLVVLRPKAELFLLKKIKPDSISAERLEWRNAVYMPASEKSLSF